MQGNVSGDSDGLPAPRRRSRTRIIALCLGAFACGALLGSFVTVSVIHRGVRRGLREPEKIAARIVSHMRSDLDLTDEQAERVLVILKRRHRAIRDAVRGELDSMRDEICTVLTEGQAALWKKKVDEMRARFFGPAGTSRPQQSGHSGPETPRRNGQAGEEGAR